MAKKRKTRQSDHEAELSEPATAQDDEAQELQVSEYQEDHEAQELQLSKYKDDTNVFSVPIEDDSDFISGMPSEILSEILSYLILDHDPERAAKQKAQGFKFKEHEHVFLSLAAMSRHFRNHVEDFCRRFLTNNKETFYFKTTQEIEKAQMDKGLRRSDRLKSKPMQPDPRCYRFILVNHLKYHCISCNKFMTRRAALANGVACCNNCDYREFPQINLTDALHKYDLRDWMLIATRKPGPRAKKMDLPVINYGTVMSCKPFYNGWCVGYRFLRTDVEKVAKAVHGDVDKHMNVKHKERFDRKLKKRQKEYVKIKAEMHEEAIDFAETESETEYHRKQLEYYRDPNCNDDYDSEGSLADDIGSIFFDEDLHKRLCIDDSCEICWDSQMRKYVPWWM